MQRCGAPRGGCGYRAGPAPPCRDRRSQKPEPRGAVCSPPRAQQHGGTHLSARRLSAAAASSLEAAGEPCGSASAAPPAPLPTGRTLGLTARRARRNMTAGRREARRSLRGGTGGGAAKTAGPARARRRRAGAAVTSSARDAGAVERRNGNALLLLTAGGRLRSSAVRPPPARGTLVG